LIPESFPTLPDANAARPTPAHPTLFLDSNGTPVGSVSDPSIDLRSAGIGRSTHLIGFRRGDTRGLRVNGKESTAQVSGAVGHPNGKRWTLPQ
jgi:hypothetical protein